MVTVTPNFALLEMSHPEVASLVTAMLQARDAVSRSLRWCTTHHLADNELELLTCAPMGAVARGRRPKLRFQNISGLPQGPAGRFRDMLRLL